MARLRETRGALDRRCRGADVVGESAGDGSEDRRARLGDGAADGRQRLLRMLPIVADGLRAAAVRARRRLGARRHIYKY